jgi:hypothetical protein
MKRKGVFIIVGLIVIVGVVAFIYLTNSNNSMLSGNTKEVDKITVSSNFDSLSEPKTLSDEEMKTVLDLLKTLRTTTVKHPKHLESMENDPAYTIKVEYENGNIDEIYSTEIKIKYFRFLDSKGPDGDKGYIISNKSDELLQFLNEKFNK